MPIDLELGRIGKGGSSNLKNELACAQAKRALTEMDQRPFPGTSWSIKLGVDKDPIPPPPQMAMRSASSASSHHADRSESPGCAPRACAIIIINIIACQEASCVLKTSCSQRLPHFYPLLHSPDPSKTWARCSVFIPPTASRGLTLASL